MWCATTRSAIIVFLPSFLAGGSPASEEAPMAPDLAAQPQCTTSSRLLKLGESIEFEFHLPEGFAPADLVIFPRYLERAHPGDDFVAGGDLGWLDELPSETVRLRFRDGRASCTYEPKAPGSYLARWRAGEETFYRYFSAVEDDWVVLRFSAFEQLEPNPTLHATGIPLDYRLPVERFREDDPLFRTFRGYHRHFGDTIIPHFPDTPGMTVDERLAAYGPGLARVRELLPDPSDGRTARVDMRHDLDTGYTETFMRLGVNEHCGLNEANAKPWLGMPEFPYFESPTDCRKADQTGTSTVVGHQWDFCGGWHFIGPVSWHYKAAEGDWDTAETCIQEGVEELVNLAAMSGHPAFAVPLYDGLVTAGYPNPHFQYALGEPRNFAGAVSDAFIVGRALSPEVIGRLMTQGLAALPDALGAWPLDGAAGETARDVSGHGRDGHFVGEPRPVAGVRGTALELDGEDDSIETDAAVAVTGTDFTIGCWVKPAATQRPFANLLSSHNNGAGTGYRGISLEQSGTDTNRFYLIGGTGTDWAGNSVTTQLTPGEWQHFVVVRRGNRLTHYLNGQVSAEGGVPDAPFAPATDRFRIGNWARGGAADDAAMLRFVERYQRLIAFELPKQHRVAFARSIDISDYYRRNFTRTPRTVFVSKTDHLLYDMWWLCNWCSQGVLVTHERIPWTTRISRVMELRQKEHPFKDPLSCEYILVEDHRRSIRFERECPNPLWWFDYTHQERGPEGSSIAHVETPDVDVLRSGWEHGDGAYRIRLRMVTAARFEDYAIALWGLPEGAHPDRAAIETNADEYILARNTDGEHHLVLLFDLEPDKEIEVSLRYR